MSALEGEDLESLLQFLYMAPVGLMQAKIDGEILMVNPVCAQLLMPLSRDGNLSNLFVALERVAPDVADRVRSFPASHGMVIDAFQLQVDACQRAPGKPRMLSLSVLKLDDQRLMAVVSDITAAVERDRQLRQSQAWIESLISGVTDYALMSLDGDGCIRHWNAGVERITGFGASATEGRSYAMFYADGDMPPQNAVSRLQEADRVGWVLDEGWRRRQDGSAYWGSCLITPLHVLAGEEASADLAGALQNTTEVEPDGHLYSLIIRDISDQREARGALRKAVYSDHLTGLSNRRAFFETGQLEIERSSGIARPLSMVMIDADHFKAVNDRFGHPTGDAVLRHLAIEISTAFHTDSAARLGGEEFAVLLPGIDLDDALDLAARFCARICAQVLVVDDMPVPYTVSAGVAAMEAGEADIDELLKRADAALYQAKAHGRNRAESWRTTPARAAEASA